MKADLIGKTIGNWFVLERKVKRVKSGTQVSWKCQCVCGTIRYKLTHVLLHDHTQQRCSKCATRDKNKTHTKYKKPFEPLYRRLQNLCKRRGKPFKLSYEEFLQFTTIAFCIYCGDKVLWSLSSQARASNLDRKNNDKGYTKNNCVVCCRTCNTIKSNKFTYEQMLEIGTLLRKWKN